MAILNASQIFELARQAGFSIDEAVIATAISLAESGGNTNVVNSIGATGLWQIYDGHFPSSARIAQLTDPVQNAKEAYGKYKGSGDWCPWAVFDEGNFRGGACPGSGTSQRNNSWRSFLAAAQAAAGLGGTPTLPGGGGGGSGDGSGGASGGSSTPGPSPAGDFVAGFIGEFSGPMVLSVGFFLVVMGFLLWKGADTVKVVNQGISTAKVPAKLATLA